MALQAVLALPAGWLIALQVVAIYDNPKIQFESRFFYPLMVLPELGVLAIICAPGFINHVLKGPQAQRELAPNHPPTIDIWGPIAFAGQAEICIIYALKTESLGEHCSVLLDPNSLNQHIWHLSHLRTSSEHVLLADYLELFLNHTLCLWRLGVRGGSLPGVALWGQDRFLE